MILSELEKDGIYDNGKGLRRKIIGFKNGKESTIYPSISMAGHAYEVVYEHINGRYARKQGICYVETFKSWAKIRVDKEIDQTSEE